MKNNKSKVVWIDDDLLFNAVMEDKLKKFQKVFFENDEIDLDFIFFNSIEDANNFINADYEKDQSEIGLIILDQNMNEHTGISYAQSLRKEGKRNYKFVLCSGELDINSLRESFKLGAISFIYKNQKIESIYSTIIHLLQHVNNSEAAISSSRSRVIRNLATGILSGKLNINTTDVFHQLNKEATLRNTTVTSLSKDIINNHNFLTEIIKK